MVTTPAERLAVKAKCDEEFLPIRDSLLELDICRAYLVELKTHDEKW